MSSHVVGQSSPSHVSPGSTTPLPQSAEQSLSLSESQPGAQQPSSFTHVVMAVDWQTASHIAALPIRASVVQALLSSHMVGQSPSQVSPASRVPFPQVAGPVDGQLSMGVMTHSAEHSVDVPASVSTVHGSPSSQVVGQLPAPLAIPGSHASPVSKTPLPQLLPAATTSV